MTWTSPPVIRLATGGDAGQIRDIYAPIVEQTAISFEVRAPGVEEMRRRIEASAGAWPWLVACAGERVLGYADACRHREREAYRWSVEVSVYVRDGCRRRGAGSGLYESLLAVLKLQGFRNAYAGITLPNPPSIALHERAGFRPVATYDRAGYKLGAWRDVQWWHRSPAPCDENPEPPRSLAEIEGGPGRDAALRLGLSRLGSP